MVLPAQQVRSLRFSTGRLSDPERELRALNERKIVLPIEPLGGPPASADIIGQWGYPGLGIVSAAFRGLRHGTGVGSSTHARNDDHLYLGVTLVGHAVAEQSGRIATLLSGDGMLFSAADGFSMAYPGRANMLGLRLSRLTLQGRLSHLDDAVMRLVPRDTPALMLLARYVGIALDESLPATSGLQEVVASHVYELVATAIGAPRENALFADGFGIRAARLRAIKADIIANLGDCDLSVATIAARHSITPRYLHKLFERDGSTYSEFVLGQRLEQVHRMLADTRRSADSISALAFAAGFGDLSYFNRAFRRRYGATPSEVRRRIR